MPGAIHLRQRPGLDGGKGLASIMHHAGHLSDRVILRKALPKTGTDQQITNNDIRGIGHILQFQLGNFAANAPRNGTLAAAINLHRSAMA